MPAKKSAKKQSGVKKSPSKARRVKKVSRLSVRDSELPFMSFQVTKQTFYWTILMIFILVVQVWVLNVQLQTAESIKNLEDTLVTSK